MSKRRILIDDHERVTYPMPWDSDATCHNFKAPTERIAPEDFPHIRTPENVGALVIGCDLTDYSFISRMVELSQLYIYSGNNISDLVFLENLVKLRQICILGTHVESLQSMIKLIELKRNLYEALPAEKELQGRITYALEGVCIQTDKYDSDGSELLDEDICSSDIVVNKHRITFRDILMKYRNTANEGGGLFHD